jgi:hypothetical protein
VEFKKRRSVALDRHARGRTPEVASVERWRKRALARSLSHFRAFSSTTPWYLLGCDPESRGALAVISRPSVGDIRTIQVLDCPREKHATRSVVSVEKTVELTEIV